MMLSFNMNESFTIPHSIAWGKFVVPLIFVLVSATKRGKVLIRNYLMFLWFLVPAVVYSFYTGTTSEYYVLLNAPMVIFSLVYLISEIVHYKENPSICTPYSGFADFGILYVSYFWQSVDKTCVWRACKTETRKCIKEGCKKEYDEGFIDSYLYSIWTDPKFKDYPKQNNK